MPIFLFKSPASGFRVTAQMAAAEKEIAGLNDESGSQINTETTKVDVSSSNFSHNTSIPITEGEEPEKRELIKEEVEINSDCKSKAAAVIIGEKREEADSSNREEEEEEKDVSHHTSVAISTGEVPSAEPTDKQPGKNELATDESAATEILTTNTKQVTHDDSAGKNIGEIDSGGKIDDSANANNTVGVHDADMISESDNKNAEEVAKESQDNAVASAPQRTNVDSHPIKKSGSPDDAATTQQPLDPIIKRQIKEMRSKLSSANDAKKLLIRLVLGVLIFAWNDICCVCILFCIVSDNV